MTTADQDLDRKVKTITPTPIDSWQQYSIHTLRERDDAYIWVLAALDERHRVIIDLHALQFILQRRYYENFPTVAWRSICYPTSKKSLTKLCVRHTTLTETQIREALSQLRPRASAYKKLVQKCLQQSE